MVHTRVCMKLYTHMHVHTAAQMCAMLPTHATLLHVTNAANVGDVTYTHLHAGAHRYNVADVYAVAHRCNDASVYDVAHRYNDADV